MLRPWLFSVSALACGCAATPAPQTSPPHEPPVPVLGVARVQVHSDVVIIPSDVEHVLYARPSATTPVKTAAPPPSPASAPLPAATQSIAAASVAPVSTAAALKDSSRSAAPAAVRVAATASPAAHPSTSTVALQISTAAPATPASPAVSAEHAPAQDVLAAWRKFCKAEDITPADWALIDTTPAPTELTQDWDRQCVPQK